MRNYTIRRGQHDSTLLPRLWVNQNMFHVKGMFNESCTYDLHSVDQYDWNKLYGISYSLTSHHTNSLRWGWRWNVEKGLFEFAPYCYIRGERKMFEPVHSCKVDQEFDLTIVDQGYYATFWVEDLEMERVEKPRLNNWGFKLDPFFGGNKSSPVTMNIQLSW